MAGRLQPIGKRTYALCRVHDAIRLGDRGRGRRELLDERGKAKLAEDLETPLALAASVLQGLSVEVHGHGGVDRRELAALTRRLHIRQQHLAPLRRQFGGVSNQIFDRPVLADQLLCPLLANPGHAFDVVDRVAHQRQHVDHLLRRDAELLFDAGRVEPHPLVPRVEHTDAFVHELKEVFVAGDDSRIESGRDGLRHQRPDHVVGLVTLRRDDRHAERFACGMHQRNLHREVIRHRRPVGLVVGDQIISKRASRQIE